MCLLKLVNKQNPLDAAFVPRNLIKDPITKTMVRRCVLQAFMRLNHDLVQNGMSPLVLISGYRSFDYQKSLFERKCTRLVSEGLDEEKAKLKAAEVVAKPGCSEHQLGLAIDITTASMKDLEDPLTEAFAYTPEAHWLQQNAANYGFVLRYPKHKTEVTQIIYEPWHYRYIGKEHAQVLAAHDMCLEEYMAYIRC